MFKKYQFSIIAVFFFFYMIIGYVENIFNRAPAIGDLLFEEVVIISTNSKTPNFKFIKNNEVYAASFPYDLAHRGARQYFYSQEEMEELRGKKVTIGYIPIKSFLRKNELFIWSMSKNGELIARQEDVYLYYKRSPIEKVFLVKLLAAIGILILGFYMDRKENR